MQKLSLGILVTCVLLFLHACGPSSSVESKPERPDILLISLDTVRADALERGPNGGQPAMPALRELAEGSIWFTNVFAPMAFTLPSHMTLLTGTHPETHYVSTEKSLLPESIPTIAEVLKEHDYETAAFVTSSWLKGAFGFRRGFDRYEELPVELTFAPRLRQRILARLSEPRAAGKPRFVFAHFFDAHSDFSSAGNKLSYFSPAEYRGDLAPADVRLCDPLGNCATELLLRADREHIELNASDIALHRELYRRGLRYLDDELARLFSELDRSGALLNTVLLVVSDHGEEFREHGKFLHSQVYRESLRVPVLARFHGSSDRGTVDRRLAGLEDVAPTLLAQLGIPVPPSWQGRNLLEAGLGSAPDLVAQDKLVRSIYSLRSADHLFVWDFATGEARGFDTVRDPGERGEVSVSPQERTDSSERLFARLRHFRSLRPALVGRSDLVFGEQERAMLRSLGYL